MAPGLVVFRLSRSVSLCIASSALFRTAVLYGGGRQVYIVMERDVVGVTGGVGKFVIDILHGISNLCFKFGAKMFLLKMYDKREEK